MERRHKVICTKLLGGRTLVHVYAESQPGPEFVGVEPGLEDVYFSVMASHHPSTRAGHGPLALAEAEPVTVAR